jgi:hypothetical protein
MVQCLTFVGLFKDICCAMLHYYIFFQVAFFFSNENT